VAIYSDGMALADPGLHRFTNEEWDRLVATGALAEVPVELVDGLVVEMSPQGEEHALTIRALTALLAGRGDLLAVQLPYMPALEGWRPEPDVALSELLGPGRPHRTHLTIEVVWSAMAEARRKIPGYLAAGVPQAWLVDVRRRVVEVHRPGGSVQILGDDELLDPEVEGIEPFAVARIWSLAQL
jgi:Uma2 family endonuclease